MSSNQKNSSKIIALLHRFKIAPNNINLYHQAFTHISYNKNYCYDRLEFLGDAVLDTFVASFLYKKFPHADSGELSKKYTQITNGKSLALAAKKLELNKLINHGTIIKFVSDNMLEDVFEALIGALYLDQKISIINSFLQQTLFQYYQSNVFDQLCDFKSELLELGMANSSKHMQIITKKDKETAKFSTVVLWGNKKISRGYGVRKIDAENMAASIALKKIKQKSL
jgi:ribonuclease-3